MQHLTYIDDFLALVKHESFSAASKAQCITQPAFSRRIKLLEESLGTVLFNRDHHPVTLTSSGEVFLQHAKSLKESAAFAYRDIQGHISALDDPIKLATSHTLAISFLPQFLKHLEPNGSIPIKLGIKYTDLCLEELRTKQTDFALLHINAQSPLYSPDEFDSCLLGHDELLSVQSPQCTKPNNFLAYAQGTQLQKYIKETQNNLKISPNNVVFESTSSEVLKALCLAGHGTAVISKSLIQAELKSNQLKINKELNISIPLQIELLRLKATRNHERQQKIWQNAQKQAIIKEKQI